MTLLLMAAGRGSRYGKLKQFDSLGPAEEFLMEFSIYDALENGFNHIVVITQTNNVDFLEEHLKSRLPDNIRLDVLAQRIDDLPSGIEYNGERPKPWGTAHAVWTARDVIDNPFVVINADDYYGKDAFKQAGEFIRRQEGENVMALVGYKLSDTLSVHGSVSRGVCEQDGKILLSVVERTKLSRDNGYVVDADTGLKFTGDELVSMNFWICTPLIFPAIEKAIRTFFDEGDLSGGEVYLPFVIQEMLQEGKIAVEVIAADSVWFGVTYADDKEKAVKILEEMTDEGDYASPLWNS